MSILKSKPKIKRTMWSRRAQEYEAKISSGKIYDLAEVVRDLNKGDDLMIDQSYSERQLFEKAYDRLLTEFQIILGIGMENTQKKLDKALKRNIENQIPKQVAENITPSVSERLLKKIIYQLIQNKKKRFPRKRHEKRILKKKKNTKLSSSSFFSFFSFLFLF